MTKELYVNTPLVKALEKILGNAKFMKDLATKKRIGSLESVDKVYHYSAIASLSLVEKKKDLRSFTILCTIRSSNLQGSYVT